MKLVTKQIFSFLIVTTYFGFALSCQNDGHENSFHNYDLLDFVKKSMEQINTSQNLKLLSEEEIDSVIEFEKFLTGSVESALLEMVSETSTNKCAEDLEYMFESLLSSDDWSMKMLDSYGKPESGILAGNTKWLGQYDECVGIHAPFKQNTKVGGFRGKYCTLQVPLKVGFVSSPISTAVCLPDSCNPNGTTFSTLQNLNLNGSDLVTRQILESAFSNAKLTCKATSRQLTTASIVVITLLSMLSLLAVIGSSITAFEYYMEEKCSKNSYVEKCKPFFNCFSIFTNGEKILNTASSEGQLPFLHGIRFLSMNWVILVHTHHYVTTLDNNGDEAIHNFHEWFFQIILYGTFSVDSFFVLSGFLLGYSFFQKAQKTNGKIQWLSFYIHRYIRITPVYMIVLAFYATVSPFLGSGPLWPDYDVIQTCKDNWWWNLLYINNFQSSVSDQCMGWSFYLANDMQFYAISPLFLITFWRWPKIGYSLFGLFFGITFTLNFVLTKEYYLTSGLHNIGRDIIGSDLNNRIPNYGSLIYDKPYTRMGPYLVGFLLAYYVYRRKRSNSPNLNWVTLSVGWIVASGIALSCQFGMYHQDLTAVEMSFYNALSRVGFALGVGWVIFVCVSGQGGVVNSILSWKVLIPLSRLTYCAFLIHPIVMMTYLNSMRTFIYYNPFNLVMLYLSFLLMSYAFALVTSLLFELPVTRLEGLYRNKLAPPKLLDINLKSHNSNHVSAI